MNSTQVKAALAVSGISLAIVVAHYVWPTIVTLDESVLGLLALAALPWLTLFFKKFKIPGLGEAETIGKTQSTTEKPLPPPAEPTMLSTDGELTPNAKKVLATLWRYQRQTFKDDNTKRWTFRLTPASNDYPHFLAGLSETVARGWVAVSPENDQCMLTNEGLAYVDSSSELRAYGDIWKF